MRNRWHDRDTEAFGDDPLAWRVYSSRLLGGEPALVLHGGGNTSVKMPARDPFGVDHDALYVKGSGWDLATIEAPGFAPVRLDALRSLSALATLTDSALVRAQRAALLDPGAPDPSIEAVLHAVIPFAFVDHTHADAVVALTNTAGGDRRAAEVFGPRMLVVPYVMPGFALARLVCEMTRAVDWAALDGLILLYHGIFTWGATARASYDAMIRSVSLAEAHLEGHGALDRVQRRTPASEDPTTLATLRRAVSRAAGRPMIARLVRTEESCGFASGADVADVSQRGPATPDHILRTKRVPVLIGDDAARDVGAFTDAYAQYFARHAAPGLTMLDAAPRWALWPGQGIVAFGASAGDAAITADIAEHTVRIIQWAEALGGWRALGERDLFDVEYWDLEQAKLRKRGAGRPLDGRVALVTGAASGIGRAVALELARQGAAVVGADVHAVADAAAGGSIVSATCDVTDASQIGQTVTATVQRFGGLDILVSNVGVFPESARLEEIEAARWQHALDVNLTSHQRLLQACIPYLRLGIDPAVILMGSKNVPAPGPGQGAYSVSKAGLTQLARVAALELGRDGIRVNVVHPNGVFDTALWTPQVIAERAAAYGLTAEAYRRHNLLGVEVTSADVARTVAALVGPAFRCTTGAQIPIDGGNDRVV